MKRNTAFTLAEVLIVLLIIGVVATITIPALMQKTQDQELKTAWKKEYSVIANAYNMILNDNGGNIQGLCTNDICFLTLFKNKLNVQKYCASNMQTDCYIPSSEVKNLAGINGNNSMGRTTGMILTDGSLITGVLRNSDCNFKDRSNATRTYCGSILIDVNGVKPPNTQGKDIFWIMVDNDKLWPAGTPGDDAYVDFDDDHDCGNRHHDAFFEGLGCSAKYLQE